MPTFITHAIAGVALGQAANRSWRREWRFWCLAAVCSIIPDLDAVGFRLGVRYGAVWGHRGFTHSLLFAAIAAVLLSFLLGRSCRERWQPALLLFIITASHGVLDAFTNGGLGVAFLSPFDLHRYFFSWRPIRVSPLGAHTFLSARGIYVLWSEVHWVWIPALLLGALLYGLRAIQKELPREKPAE